jgi:hypothetical protein
MTETKAQRIIRLVEGVNEALVNSENRIIVIVANSGMTVNGVSKYRYTFLIPEGERTYDFTAQISAILGYRYNVTSWTCVSQDSSLEMKGALCHALDRKGDRVYLDLVYREVWNNPTDTWIRRD